MQGCEDQRSGVPRAPMELACGGLPGIVTVTSVSVTFMHAWRACLLVLNVVSGHSVGDLSAVLGWGGARGGLGSL